MYQTEDIISKFITTTDGDQEFQLRYIRDENVGIATTRTDQSFFILDSADYWYDLIQEKYPPVMKCSCKNDFFNLTFHYTPRVGTDDFKEIRIACRCTACQKLKKLPPIEIDYSPSSHLFDSPITFCRQPKIKYKKCKTHSVMGYWSQEELLGITDYLSQNSRFIYCWYWDSASAKRCIKELSSAELRTFLINGEERYLAIYFSEEPLDVVFMHAPSDEKGILIQQGIWREKCAFMLDGPFEVFSHGLFYQLHFCSEYLDKEGNIVSKAASFCKLVQNFQKHSRKLLKS